MTPFEQTLQYVAREIHFMSKDSSGGYNNAIYANKVIEDICGLKNVATKVVCSMEPASEVYKFTSGYKGRMLLLFFNVSLHDTRMALAELIVEYEMIRMSYDKKSVKAAEYLIKLYRKTVKKVLKLLTNARSKKKYKKMYKSLEDFVDADIDDIEFDEDNSYDDSEDMEEDFDDMPSLKSPKGHKRSNTFLNKLGFDPKTPEEVKDAMIQIEEGLGRPLTDDEIEAIFFEDDELDEDEDGFEDDDDEPVVTEKMIETAVEKVLAKMLGGKAVLEPEETEHFETMEEFLERTAPKKETEGTSDTNPYPDVEVGSGENDVKDESGGVEIIPDPIPTDEVSTEELIKYHNIRESKYAGLNRTPDVIKCRPVQVVDTTPDPVKAERVNKDIHAALDGIRAYNKKAESNTEDHAEEKPVEEEVVETPVKEEELTSAVESETVDMADMNVEVGSVVDDEEEDTGVEIPLAPVRTIEKTEDEESSVTALYEVPLDPKILDPLFRQYNVKVQEIFDKSPSQDGIGCTVCDSIINLEPSTSLDYFITINARLRYIGNFDCFDEKPIIHVLNELRSEIAELLHMTKDKIWIDYQGYFGDEPFDEDLTDLLKNEAAGFNGVTLSREYVLDMYNMAALYIAHIYNKYAFHAAIGIINDPRNQKITYVLTNVGNAKRISDLNNVMGKYDTEMQNTLNTLLDANITLTTMLSLSLNTDFRGFYLDQVKLATPLVQQEVYENNFIDNLHKEVEESIKDEAEYFPYVDDKGDVRPKLTGQYYSTDISHNGYQHLSVETIHSYTTDIAFEKPTDHNDLVDEISVCAEYCGRELERLRALTSNVSVVTKVVYEGISKKEENSETSEKKEAEVKPVVAG